MLLRQRGGAMSTGPFEAVRSATDSPAGQPPAEIGAAVRGADAVLRGVLGLAWLAVASQANSQPGAAGLAICAALSLLGVAPRAIATGGTLLAVLIAPPIWGIGPPWACSRSACCGCASTPAAQVAGCATCAASSCDAPPRWPRPDSRWRSTAPATPPHSRAPAIATRARAVRAPHSISRRNAGALARVAARRRAVDRSRARRLAVPARSLRASRVALERVSYRPSSLSEASASESRSA